MPHLRAIEVGRRGPDEDDGQEHEARHLEDAQEAAPRQDAHGQEGEDHPPGETAELLEGLDAAHHLLLVEARKDAHLGEAGHDAGHVLDGPEGGAVAAREHEGGDEGDLLEVALEDRRQARALEGPGFLLHPPGRGFRQEGADDDQRDGGDDARDQGVAPRRVAPGDRGQGLGEVDGEEVGARHHQAAHRREGLGPAQHGLPPPGFGEQLRQPRHRRHELDAHADEGRAAEEEQPADRGREARGHRGERVEQDAPHEDAATAEQVGEVAPEQAEDPAGDGGQPEEPPHPEVELRGARLRAEEIEERRPHDEGQHEQLVDVEGEAERGDEADQPLGPGEGRVARGVGRGGHLGISSSPTRRTSPAGCRSSRGCPARARRAGRRRSRGGPSSGP